MQKGVGNELAAKLAGAHPLGRVVMNEGVGRVVSGLGAVPGGVVLIDLHRQGFDSAGDQADRGSGGRDTHCRNRGDGRSCGGTGGAEEAGPLGEAGDADCLGRVGRGFHLDGRGAEGGGD